MLTKIRSFLRDETGATAIEYGLIAALVSVPAIVALEFNPCSGSMWTKWVCRLYLGS